MKIIKKFQFFIILTLLGVLTFGLTRKALASYIIDDTETCPNSEWCQEKYGEGTLCQNSHCVQTVVPKSSYENFQEARENCGNTGILTSECYWAGTPDQEATDTEPAKMGIAGAGDNLVNFFVNALYGEEILKIATGKQSITENYQPGGALATMGRFVDRMYQQKPASAIEYVADLGKNFGIISHPVYAQGIGFTGLTSFLPLWKVFRNMAYLFLTVVLLILGLMIMLRNKLDPKTVISVQYAIPKIAVALIFITFSYAIAGLLIDLIYLIIGIFIFSMGFFGAIPSAEATKRFNDMINQSLISFTTFLTGRGIGLIFDILKGTALGTGISVALIIQLLLTIIDLFFTKGAATTVGTAVGIAKGAVGGIAGIGVSIFVVGLGITIFGLLIQIIFMLAKTYITLLFNIILGPIYLLFAALPSKDGSSFGSWIKSIISQVLVFAFVAIIITLGDIMMSFVDKGNVWGPPFIGRAGGELKIAIGLGILALLPHVDEIVKTIVEGKGMQFAFSSREFESLQKQASGVLSKPGEAVGWSGDKGWGQKFKTDILGYGGKSSVQH